MFLDSLALIFGFTGGGIFLLSVFLRLIKILKKHHLPKIWSFSLVLIVVALLLSVANLIVFLAKKGG